jgi:hypothetical protein
MTASESKVPKSNAGEKIIVASKLEMALQIQRREWRTEQRRDRSVSWEERVAVSVGPVVILAGTGFPNGPTPEGMERPRTMSGAALTFNVDREWFEAWLEENAEFPPVKNHLIFAHKTEDGVRGLAKDYKDIDSGLGPIKHSKNADGEDVITDTRVPKKVRQMTTRAQMSVE